MSRPIENLKWGGHGERAGNAAAAVPLVAASQFARWVKVKANIDNAGNVNVGKATMTKPAGTSTLTGGYPLDAAQETDWLPVPGHDLANVFIQGDNNGDDVCFLWLE